MQFRARMLIALAALPLVAACASTPYAPPPPSIDAYVKMVYDSTQELLNKQRETLGPDGGASTITIAVLPMKYVGDLDGASNDGELYGAISNAVTDSGMFAPVSRDMIRAGMNAARVGSRENLYIAEVRERFLSVLQSEAIDAEYFIFPELTTLSTVDTDGRITQRKATIRLQLAHSRDGSLADESSGSHTQSL